MNRTATSKRIWIEQSEICYQVGNGVGWKLPITDVEMIGEYTDPNGPYVDDYFLVFIRRPEHYWNEASFYADGRDQFLMQLGDLLGAGLTCGLTNSTNYSSRVMWPTELESKGLFEFVPVEADGLWEKLKYKLVPEYKFQFTGQVVDYLKGGG